MSDAKLCSSGCTWPSSHVCVFIHVSIKHELPSSISLRYLGQFINSSLADWNKLHALTASNNDSTIFTADLPPPQRVTRKCQLSVLSQSILNIDLDSITCAAMWMGNMRRGRTVRSWVGKGVVGRLRIVSPENIYWVLNSGSTSSMPDVALVS